MKKHVEYLMGLRQSAATSQSASRFWSQIKQHYGKYQRRVSHFFSLRISENLRYSDLEARFALSTFLRLLEKL